MRFIAATSLLAASLGLATDRSLGQAPVPQRGSRQTYSASASGIGLARDEASGREVKILDWTPATPSPLVGKLAAYGAECEAAARTARQGAVEGLQIRKRQLRAAVAAKNRPQIAALRREIAQLEKTATTVPAYKKVNLQRDPAVGDIVYNDGVYTVVEIVLWADAPCRLHRGRREDANRVDSEPVLVKNAKLADVKVGDEVVFVNAFQVTRSKPVVIEPVALPPLKRDTPGKTTVRSSGP